MITQVKESIAQDDIEYEINILQCIVTYPAVFAPQLSDFLLRKAIVFMIELYIVEQTVTLSELTYIAETLHLFMGSGRDELGGILAKICSLADPSVTKEVLYDTLLAVLQKIKRDFRCIDS